jgi:Domain of unknown function (DUF4352)
MEQAVTRNRLLLIGAVAGLSLGALTACKSYTNSAPYVPPSATSPAAVSAAAAEVTSSSPAAPIAGIGQSVTDSPLSFVVSKVQCGISSLTSEFETGTPSQGQFCIVVVAETNLTNTPQETASGTTMTDTQGNTYDTSDDVSAQVAAQDEYLGSHYEVEAQINPGSHYSDVFVFDVPRGVQAETVTLYGDLESNGVTVSVK